MSRTLERTAAQGCSVCGDSGRVWACADGYGSVPVRCACGQPCREASTMPLVVAEIAIGLFVAAFTVSAMLLLT